MATYKRIKLFVNESFASEDMVIYDEIWTAKLEKTESDYEIFKYRIRYYSSKNPMAFGFDPGQDAEEISSVIEEFGPAISCYLEVWSGGTWSRCLDWFGDTSFSAEQACMELNDQYRSFITGVPIKKGSTSRKPVPSAPKKIKPNPADVGYDSIPMAGIPKSSVSKIDDLIKKYAKKPKDKNSASDDDSDDDFWI